MLFFNLHLDQGWSREAVSQHSTWPYPLWQFLPYRLRNQFDLPTTTTLILIVHSESWETTTRWDTEPYWPAIRQDSTYYLAPIFLHSNIEVNMMPQVLKYSLETCGYSSFPSVTIGSFVGGLENHHICLRWCCRGLPSDNLAALVNGLWVWKLPEVCKWGKRLWHFINLNLLIIHPLFHLIV